MSLGGWQQVHSPRHIGESMLAASANYVLGSCANSASLCRFRLPVPSGKNSSAHMQYLSSAQRAQTHTHTRKRGQTCTAHTCSVRKYAWHERSAHTYRGTHADMHSRPLTARHLCTASDFSLCFILCPCFCFHKLLVPLLPSSHSLILSLLLR